MVDATKPNYLGLLYLSNTVNNLCINIGLTTTRKLCNDILLLLDCLVVISNSID